MGLVQDRIPGAAVLRILVALATAFAFATLDVGSARAQGQFGISSFTTSLSTAQAGDHPDQTTDIQFAIDPTVNDPNSIKDSIVQLPPGFVGNPTAVPECPQSDLESATSECPTDTQIGVMTATLVLNSSFSAPITVPISNLVPLPGQTAVFGGTLLSGQVRLVSSVRSAGDYGVTVTSADITEILPIKEISLTLWGVPADSSHDAQRYMPGSYSPGDGSGNPLPAGIAPAAFLTNPSDCSSGPLTATLQVDSWEDPGTFYTATAPWPTPTGCGLLPAASPSLSVQPAVSRAGAPSGYDVDLTVPQNENPYSLATPPLKDVSVTLPQGVELSAPAANGLSGCTDAELGLHSLAPATCPGSAKIGSVEIDTPLLPDPLTGSVYVGSQVSASDPFRIFLVAQGDGVTVKLAGDVHADPATGQLTTTFENNPQVGFSKLRLDFFGGPGADLSNPPACGTYTATSDITPYGGGADQSPQATFSIDQGCGAASAFSPSLSAGVTNPVAGAFTGFVMDLTRPDGQQNVSGLSVTLPPGVSAKLAGVPLCPDPDTASGDCPAGSQVGTVTAAVGDGSSPLYLPQPGDTPTAVYLGGAYKGAPYSLVLVVPAQAGPYDLGTVVVRAALFVDPTDAHVTVVSDPLPQLVRGVPNEYQRIYVNINRPGFMLAPTSCNPMEITASVTGAPLGGPVSVDPNGVASATGSGAVAQLSTRFQVGDCQALGFSPKLKIALSGNGKTRSGDHPTLSATLSQPLGQANIRQAKVALPLSLALDPNNSQHVCNYQVAQAVHGGSVGCPASTIVGQATAVTPLLSQPLTGPVYLVQGIRFGAQGQAIHTLPSLLIPLRGQIALDLRAQSSVSGGKLVTTFSTIPDAPVSKFTLQITGGRKGLLVITGRGQTICGKAQVASGQFGAQSGKTEAMSPTLATPACGRPASLRAVRVVGHAVHLTVRVPAAGRLVARGAGLRSQVRRPGRAGTVSLVLDVSPAEAERLNRTGRLSTKVTVNWTPRGGGLHSMTTGMLTIRR